MSVPRKRTSDVWKYFHIDPEDDRRAVCNYCQTRIVRGLTKRSYGTSSMQKHIKTCKKFFYSRILPNDENTSLSVPSPHSAPPLDADSNLSHSCDFKPFKAEIENSSPEEICVSCDVKISNEEKELEPFSENESQRGLACQISDFSNSYLNNLHQEQEKFKVQHDNHFSCVLESLANDQTFMDVTLTAQGKSIKAHKSVLSAVSSYFEDVLKENPCQHPVIIMPHDICFDELSNLVTYIYRGEITVPTEDLSNFLKAGEVLQITGLGTPDSTRSSSSQPPRKKLKKRKSQKSVSIHFQPSIDIHKKRSYHQTSPTIGISSVKMETSSDVESTEDAKPDPVPVPVLNETRKDSLPLSKQSDTTHESPPTPPLPLPREAEKESLKVSSSFSMHASSPPPLTKENEKGSLKISSDLIKCPFCSEIHGSYASLKAHLCSQHSSENTFVCNCGLVFVLDSDYEAHARNCK